MKPTHLAAGAALTVGALLSSTALAQDAATIERLERTIQQQQQQIDQQNRLLESLQSEIQQMKQAQEDTTIITQETAKRFDEGVARSGQGNVVLEVSGQVNRMVNIAGDGDGTTVYNVDNDNSSSRVRFVGRAQVSEELQLGTNFEVQFESNSSADVSQDETRGVGSNSFTERKIEIFANHKRFGRLWLGQGDTASNGTSEVDLSSTTVIAYSGIVDQAGGLQFRDSNTGELTGVAIGDVFDQLDGLSRDDRIRYDTPKFFGFQASTSLIASAERWDVALRWGGEFADFKGAAAVAYGQREDDGPNNRNRLNGSASVLHDPTGLNLTFAAGRDEFDETGRNNANFWYVKGGWIARFFEIGRTAFSIDYTRHNDIDQNDDEAKSYGLFAVQHVEDYGVEVYAGVRNHELDRPGLDTDDIIVGSVGGRFRF